MASIPAPLAQQVAAGAGQAIEQAALALALVDLLERGFQAEQDGT